ncbi:MAG: nucleoside-diphosphate sugar epimerase/dehydratase [Pseudomonadota bacterium]
MIINREHLRNAVLMTVDAFIILLSFYTALLLAGRDFADIHYQWYEYLWMFSVVVAVKIFIFHRMGLYREIIRFASMGFAVKVVKVTVFGSLASVILIHIVRTEIGLPVFTVDWMGSCILIGLSRFGMRYVMEGRLSPISGKRTLLYGAGDHGAAVARHLKLTPRLGYRVVGFVDDNPEKSNKKVHGIHVVGNLNTLPEVLENMNIEDVIVTFSDIDGDIVKRIVHICKERGVRTKIVPGMADVITGNEFVRNIDIADLMRRPQRSLDKGMIGEFLRGKRVLITGAAGSIGSEIFRQVLEYEPAAIGALDHSEYGLYKLDEEFASHPCKNRCFFSLVDIKLSELVDDTFDKFKPDIIFHAAAYKHVPILEQDVRQAILNNVKGLMNVIAASKSYGVSKFVFISTDKAVRPTNVMGATKRIGELLVQQANGDKDMNCMSVRFGNVLGSSGSVVPKFTAQVRAGGPVTVTHPEITRYFMLIPEAVELVLQAASIGNGGEIFVLDMGKPVRIKEMAEDLISLMGHVPHSGIPIVYTGLRPGEKLYEELFLGEVERATPFKDIHIGKMIKINEDVFHVDLNKLFQAVSTGDSMYVREAVKNLVPEYTFGRI